MGIEIDGISFILLHDGLFYQVKVGLCWNMHLAFILIFKMTPL